MQQDEHVEKSVKAARIENEQKALKKKRQKAAKARKHHEKFSLDERHVNWKKAYESGKIEDDA